MYADRMKKLQPSFIREIMKAIGDEKIISFAGGLPNPDLFPLAEIKVAANKVSDQKQSLQYSTTEGHKQLRKWIVERYYPDCGFDEENILITNGSQQALDLIGKMFINKNDRILMESPGYLGAIQAFAVYEPEFIPVGLDEDGMRADELANGLRENPKLIYTVTNFQNPTGISYSEARKKELLRLIGYKSVYVIEDNPYQELQYSDEQKTPLITQDQEKVISLGSFSKIFAPSMRLGWVAAKKELIDDLVKLKQSADLHTNYFSQCLLHAYLEENNMDDHIRSIKKDYGNKLQVMLDSLDNAMPETIGFTRPNGGMFVWLTLEKTMDAFDLLELSKQRGVIFVPGSEFFIDGTGSNTLRLNFSNSTEQEIAEGIAILGDCITALMNGRTPL